MSDELICADFDTQAKLKVGVCKNAAYHVHVHYWSVGDAAKMIRTSCFSGVEGEPQKRTVCIQERTFRCVGNKSQVLLQVAGKRSSLCSSRWYFSGGPSETRL